MLQLRSVIMNTQPITAHYYCHLFFIGESTQIERSHIYLVIRPILPETPSIQQPIKYVVA